MKTPQEEAQEIIQQAEKEPNGVLELVQNRTFLKHANNQIFERDIEFREQQVDFHIIKALLQTPDGQFGLGRNPQLARPNFPDRDNLVKTLLQTPDGQFGLGQNEQLYHPVFHDRDNLVKTLLQTREGQLGLGRNPFLSLPDFHDRDNLVKTLLQTRDGQRGLGQNAQLSLSAFHDRDNLIKTLLQTPHGQFGLGRNPQLASPDFHDRDNLVKTLLQTPHGQGGLGQNPKLASSNFPDRDNLIKTLLQTTAGQFGLSQNPKLASSNFLDRDNLIKTLLQKPDDQFGLGRNPQLANLHDRNLIIQKLLKTKDGKDGLSENPDPKIQAIKTEFDLHNFLTENPLPTSTVKESNTSIITDSSAETLYRFPHLAGSQDTIKAPSLIESSIPSTRESIHDQVNELIEEHPELKTLAPEMKANAETLDQIPELKRAIGLEVKAAKENGEPNPLEVIERATKSLEQGTARQADEIKELAKVSPDGAYVYNQVYKGLSYLPLLLPATKGGLLKHGLSSKLGQSIGLSLNVLAGLEKMVDGGVISGIAAVAGLGITKDAGVNLVTAIDQKHQLKKAEKGQAQIAEIQQVVTPDDELEAMKKFAHPTARLLTHDYNSLPAEWGSDRENASSNMLEALYSALHSSEFEKGNFPHRKPVLDFDHGLQGTVDSAVSKTLESRMGTFSTNKKEKADARLAQLKIIDHNFLGRLPAPTPNTKGKDKAVVLPLSALQSLGSALRHQGKLFNPETSSLRSIESRSSTSTTPSLRTAYKELKHKSDELKQENIQKDQRIDEQEERIKRLEAMVLNLMPISSQSQAPNPTPSTADVVKRPSFDRSQSPQLRRPSSPSNPLKKP